MGAQITGERIYGGAQKRSLGVTLVPVSWLFN